eukprot:1154881-Pelagomonas_calceolata.AAC.2
MHQGRFACPCMPSMLCMWQLVVWCIGQPYTLMLHAADDSDPGAAAHVCVCPYQASADPGAAVHFCVCLCNIADPCAAVPRPSQILRGRATEHHPYSAGILPR